MKRANQIASIVVILFSVALMFESRKLVYTGEFGRPGAGFLPFWLGILLALLAALNFYQNRLRPGEVDRPGPFSSLGRMAKPAVILGALAGFAALASMAGFLITIALFLAFLLILVEKYRWLPGLGTAVLGALCFYMIFEVWLGVPLPVGVLGL